MKQYVEWLLQNKSRRLEISAGGRWFIFFTITLGVVAIFSGNNVIYLLESMLLAAFVLSGVLSEITIGKPKLRRILGQAIAGVETKDILELSNPLPIPLYCIEVLERTKEGLSPIGFAIRLPAKGHMRLSSRQALPKRGEHHWNGLVLATSFPFGFARKLRFLDETGIRIVWPRTSQPSANFVDSARDRNQEWETAEGELSESQGDYSKVHWPSSLRSGELLERALRPLYSSQRVELWINSQEPNYEEKISATATSLLRGAQELMLRWPTETRLFQGSSAGLDALSLLPPGRSDP
jgi:uncharacterized protein (DUF58 family)